MTLQRTPGLDGAIGFTMLGMHAADFDKQIGMTLCTAAEWPIPPRIETAARYRKRAAQ